MMCAHIHGWLSPDSISSWMPDASIRTVTAMSDQSQIFSLSSFFIIHFFNANSSLGQALTHLPQPIHASGLTTTTCLCHRNRFIPKTLCGHASTHFQQWIHPRRPDGEMYFVDFFPSHCFFDAKLHLAVRTGNGISEVMIGQNEVFAEFGGCFTGLFFEQAREIGIIVVAERGCDFAHILHGVGKQPFRNYDNMRSDK